MESDFSEDIISHKLLYCSLIYCFSLFQPIIYCQIQNIFLKKVFFHERLFKVLRNLEAGFTLFSCKVNTKLFAPPILLYKVSYLTYATYSSVPLRAWSLTSLSCKDGQPRSNLLLEMKAVKKLKETTKET